MHGVCHITQVKHAENVASIHIYVHVMPYFVYFGYSDTPHIATIFFLVRTYVVISNVHCMYICGMVVMLILKMQNLSLSSLTTLINKTKQIETTDFILNTPLLEAVESK